MSRLSFRSAAVLALVAAGPLAAHYYTSHAGGTEPGVAALASAPDTGRNQGQASPEVTSGSEPISPTAADMKQVAGAAQAAAEDAVRQTICSFLEEYAAAPAGPKPTQAPISWCPVEVANKPVFVLGFLPDPVRTHLELRFDRGIDDLEDAAEAGGWAFDSQWLPWDNRPNSDPGRFGGRLLDSASRKARNQTAGALLFRARSEKPEPPGAGGASPLIVLAVGDTPTGGVSAPQLRSAMSLWRELRGVLANPDELNILGPSFSGSVQSVAAVLPQELRKAGGNASDACGGVALHIASGTITVNEQLKDLKSICSHTDVVSFAMDAAYESEMLEAFLADRSVGRNIAELSEQETVFGEASTGGETEDTTAATGERGNGGKRGRRKENEPVAALSLQFPREISRLREAYEQNSIIGFGSSGDTPRSQLRFATGEEHQGTDSVPVFSDTQSTLSMESEMAEIAATLEEQRISTVLLSATDVFDEIFVARYLQQHAPRVTVIIKDADLLFLRRGQDAGLQNTYVASPYPLIPQNQLWTERQAGRGFLTHQSQGDQGAVTAAFYLLLRGQSKDGVGLDEYRSPFVTGTEFDTHPPLWLSMIGHGQFAPVALVDSDLEDRSAPTLSHGWKAPAKPAENLPAVSAAGGAEAKGVSTDLPLQTKLLVAGIGVLLLWHAAACALARLDRRFAWSYALADAEHHKRRLALQILLSMLAVPALMVLDVPEATNFHVRVGYFSGMVRGLIVCAGLIASYSLVRLCWIRWAFLRWLLRHNRESARKIERWARERSWPMVRKYSWPSEMFYRRRASWQRRKYRAHRTRRALRLLASLFQITRAHALPDADKAAYVKRGDLRLTVVSNLVRTVFLAAGLLVLGGVAWLLCDWTWTFLQPWLPSERVFFFYRSALMIPGVSPTFPLLLLFGAVVWWVHSLLSRLAFFGHRIPRMPNGFVQQHCPDTRALKPVTDLFAGFSWTSLNLFVISVVLVGAVLRMSQSLGPTSLGEGRFDVWVRVFTFAVAVLILHDIAIAGWGWHKLHQHCLMPLKRSTLRWGFSWIQGFSWKRIWTGARVLSPDILFDYLSRMRETNERLAYKDPDMDAAFDELIDSLRKPLSRPSWSESVARKFIALHGFVAKAAEWKLGELAAVWEEDEGPLTGTEPERGLHRLEPVEELKGTARNRALDRMAKEEFVALLYLGYIRMVLIQIRNRVMTAVVCYVLLLWALTSYTWTNHHAIIVAMSALLGVLSVAVIYIYAGMHRDDILSRTTETEPGKLDSEFFEKTIPTIGLPLLSLVATQFPEFSDLIFSFLEPGLRGH